MRRGDRSRSHGARHRRAVGHAGGRAGFRHARSERCEPRRPRVLPARGSCDGGAPARRGRISSAIRSFGMTRTTTTVLLGAACIGIAFAALPAASHAKIVCWKDKAGKVVGCGDAVPPEYQESATKELDKRGVTRSTTESAQDAARQRAQSEETAKLKVESERRAAEQKRQDSALIATYASEQEIDGKRDRDLQAIDLQLSQLRMSLKNAAERQKDAKSRIDVVEKNSKNVDALKDEASRAAEQVKKLE